MTQTPVQSLYVVLYLDHNRRKIPKSSTKQVPLKMQSTTKKNTKQFLKSVKSFQFIEIEKKEEDKREKKELFKILLIFN